MNLARQQEKPNPKATAIHEVLKVLLRDDIFPDKSTRRTFEAKEAEAYVARREIPKYLLAGEPTEFEGEPEESAPASLGAVDHSPQIELPTLKSGTLLRFESEMDELFWHRSISTIIVEGEPGCGKSTFVDYYLRCYCPHYPETGRAEKFKRNLNLTIDFRQVQTENDIHRIFSKNARQQIEEAFKLRASLSIQAGGGCRPWRCL